MLSKRYFWKVLLIFIGIFYITFQVTWLTVSFYHEHKNDEQISKHIAVISQLLNFSGEKEALSYIDSLPDHENELYKVSLINEHETSKELNSTHSTFSHVAKTPSGHYYFVEYNPKNAPENLYFDLPFSVISLIILTGFLCSIILAWNLTSPINMLKMAFNSVADGDFSIRIHPKLKSRYDEFSELGSDFDKMIEKLELLISARRSLLHDVSHELKTPLARLQLAIGIAQQDHDNIDKSLERIELEAMRISDLVTEILNYLRVDFSEEEQSRFNFDLLMDSLILSTSQHAKLKHKYIIFHSKQSQINWVYGNQVEISCAIEHIIRNAVRFSPPHGVINVSVVRDNHFVTIKVVDQGPGVAPDKLSSIFEPFIRIQSPSNGKGYGLGLAVTKKIIAVHNGSIYVENGKKNGLVVTISLPLFSEENLPS